MRPRGRWVGRGWVGGRVGGREGFLWLTYKSQKCSNTDLVEKTAIPGNTNHDGRRHPTRRRKTYFEDIILKRFQRKRAFLRMKG